MQVEQTKDAHGAKTLTSIEWRCMPMKDIVLNFSAWRRLSRIDEKRE